MKIGFLEAVRRGFASYARFRGRAQVAEFWWWVLLWWVTVPAVMVVESTLSGSYSLTKGDCGPGVSGACFGYAFNGGPVTAVIMLVLLIPSLAVLSRRLHDTDRSFWWLLLGLIPLIGTIILIVWTATPGTAGPNRFGPDPANMAGSDGPKSDGPTTSL